MRAPVNAEKHDALMAGLKELEDRFLIRRMAGGLYYVLLTHRQGERRRKVRWPVRLNWE